MKVLMISGAQRLLRRWCVRSSDVSFTIRKMREYEEEFYCDILIAERNYAKTKRFWKQGKIIE